MLRWWPWLELRQLQNIILLHPSSLKACAAPYTHLLWVWLCDVPSWRSAVESTQQGCSPALQEASLVEQLLVVCRHLGSGLKQTFQLADCQVGIHLLTPRCKCMRSSVLFAFS